MDFDGLPLDRVRLARREIVDSGRPCICAGGRETRMSSRSFSVEDIVCEDPSKAAKVSERFQWDRTQNEDSPCPSSSPASSCCSSFRGSSLPSPSPSPPAPSPSPPATSPSPPALVPSPSPSPPSPTARGPSSPPYPSPSSPPSPTGSSSFPPYTSTRPEDLHATLTRSLPSAALRTRSPERRDSSSTSCS